MLKLLKQLIGITALIFAYVNIANASFPWPGTPNWYAGCTIASNIYYNGPNTAQNSPATEPGEHMLPELISKTIEDGFAYTAAKNCIVMVCIKNGVVKKAAQWCRSSSTQESN